MGAETVGEGEDDTDGEDEEEEAAKRDGALLRARARRGLGLEQR